MNGRVWIAGIVAGVTVFVWGMVSHMALPLGQIGVRPMPNAEKVLPALSDNVAERGLYLFPWEEDPEKWQEAYKTTPRGILVLTPAAQPYSIGAMLATEAATNIAGGVLAAFLFVAAGLAGAGFGRTIAFGATLGGFASLAIDFSYWNWYGFPTNYLAAQLIDGIIAWSLAAVAMGMVLRRR